MSTHSYEIEEAQQEPNPEIGHIPDPDEDDDLMFDLQAAAVRGFYTPYHPM